MESYFDTLPTYLAEELLLASHSYELISRHRELIDDDLKEFIDEMEKDDHDVVYLLLKAIEYELYDIIKYLSDEYLNKGEEDEYLDIEYYLYDSDIVSAATKNGDYYIVIQLMDSLPFLKRDLFAKLAREGHYPLIDRLLDEGYLDDNYTLYSIAAEAAEAGNEEFVESIIDDERFSKIYSTLGHKQSKERIYHSVIESIALGFAAGGHLESLKWAMSLQMYDQTLEYIFNMAIAKGRREVVEYLLDEGAIVNDLSIKSAIKSGDLELLKFLMTFGQFDVDHNAGFATVIGQIDIVRYLLSIGANRENVAEALRGYIESAHDVGMVEEELLPYTQLLEELTN